MQCDKVFALTDTDIESRYRTHERLVCHICRRSMSSSVSAKTISQYYGSIKCAFIIMMLVMPSVAVLARLKQRFVFGCTGSAARRIQDVQRIASVNRIGAISRAIFVAGISFLSSFLYFFVEVQRAYFWYTLT